MRQLRILRILILTPSPHTPCTVAHLYAYRDGLCTSSFSNWWGSGYFLCSYEYVHSLALACSPKIVGAAFHIDCLGLVEVDFRKIFNLVELQLFAVRPFAVRQ